MQIAPPEVAVITTVALVHACSFETIEEIARTKGRNFFTSQTRNWAFCMRDIPHFSGNLPNGKFSKNILFRLLLQADYRLDQLNHTGSSHGYRIPVDKATIPIGPLPIPGKHNFHNLLAAIAVARYFNIDWEEIQSSIPRSSYLKKDCNLFDISGILFLNDSYNAAELSVKAALESLPQPERMGGKLLFWAV